MMVKVIVLVLMIFVLFIWSASADLKFETGTFTITGIETTTNEDGSPVTDLNYTTLYYQIDDGELVFVVDIPASSPSGGEAFSHTLTIDVPIGSEVSIRAGGTSSDLAKKPNVSEYAYSNIIRIDKLAPGSPQF